MALIYMATMSSKVVLPNQQFRCKQQASSMQAAGKLMDQSPGISTHRTSVPIAMKLTMPEPRKQTSTIRPHLTAPLTRCALPNTTNIPQVPALQIRDSEVTGHNSPPSAAAVVMARVRVLKPVPHVAEHPLHEPHWSTTQSTGQRHTCAAPLAGSQAATS